MLTVACVLSTGPKRIYDGSHVARLMRQVAGNLSAPYRFVCLTDSILSLPVPNAKERMPACQTIPLKYGWSDVRDRMPGWWAKIELFRPGLFTGRVLYLDLDVTVVGSLDQIANHPSPFAAIKDWQRPTINSSVMAWDAGEMDGIYTNFTPSVMERLAGDQDWISEQIPNAETFPAKWCPSYRQSIRKFGVNGETKVVVYNGFPKSWDLPPDHLRLNNAF